MTVTRGIIFIFLKPFFIFRSEAFLYLSKLCIFLHTVLCPSSYLFIWWSHTFPAPIQKTNFHFTLFYNMQQKQTSFLRTGNTPSSLYSIPSTHSALQILDHGRSFWSLGQSRAEQNRAVPCETTAAGGTGSRAAGYRAVGSAFRRCNKFRRLLTILLRGLDL